MTPLTSAEQVAYLARIGIDPVAATTGGPGPELLAELQLAHLLSVPFENLDIARGRAIVLDPDRIFAKVVERGRGGYCYELNSLFARLLRSVGYEVTLVSARVARDDGTFSPEFDHLTLLVGGDDGTGSGRWLVDVGFGDAFSVPIPLVDGVEVDDRGHRTRLVDRGDHWVYQDDRVASDAASPGHEEIGWRPRYRFSSTPQHLDAFGARNRWQQSSPDSHFTRQSVCTRLTPDGRVTVSGAREVTTAIDGRRSEEPLDADQVEARLGERFGISLAAPPTLDQVPAEILDNLVATLATNGADGRPQLTAIWFGVEDGELCISVTESTQKARNLRNDGRCTVLIYDPATPSRVAEIRGWATITPDPDYVFADWLGTRYDTDYRIFDAPDAERLRVAIRPQRIVITDVR